MWSSFEYLLIAAICASSSSSIRATGTPDLDRLDHGIDGVRQTRKGADRSRDRLRNAVEPHGQLGNDPERALGADKQPGQIIAGRRFARAPRGSDDPAVGEHYGQGQHVLAHRPVAHRIGARGAGRRHAAERGVGAGIDRKEEAGVAQIFVQLLVRDPGFDGGVEIGGADPQDLVHLRQVDADAAVDGGDLTFERGAGPEGDDRRLAFGAELDDRGDLVGGPGKGDGVRRVRRMVGFVPAVLGADRRLGRQPIAEQLAQGGNEALIERRGGWRQAAWRRSKKCAERGRELYSRRDARATRRMSVPILAAAAPFASGWRRTASIGRRNCTPTDCFRWSASQNARPPRRFDRTTGTGDRDGAQSGHARRQIPARPGTRLSDRAPRRWCACR